MNEKPFFRVRVVHSQIHEVEVRAIDSLDAEKIARGSSTLDLSYGLKGHNVDAVTIEQIGEPWVYGWSGDSRTNVYHGRPDQYQNTKDLLVFNAPYGRAFSAEDVLLLIDRTQTFVGKVSKSWNGAGCGTLSIRLEEPFGKLTDEQVDYLMAPRPT